MNTAGQYVTSVATSDGLGHVIGTLLTPDPDCTSGGDRTDTTYDGQGHAHTVSNPYCTTSDPTYGVTTYAYDALGRTTQVTHPDNSTILTTYTGRATQVQDEGNGNGAQRVTRISQSDGLGRLNSLCEVSSSSLLGQSGSPAACGQDFAGTGFLTSYGYDVLGNLLQVTQGTMAARMFAYDSLSRLTSASNPESGSVAIPTTPTATSSPKPPPRQTRPAPPPSPLLIRTTLLTASRRRVIRIPTPSMPMAPPR
jgi:YD repeat-containing protein